MNLPNKLTISRIILTLFFVFFLFSRGLSSKVITLVIFFLAVLTDYFDGYFARKYNLVSDFGRLLDPIADKILTLSAFISFVIMGIIPAWMVLIITIREFFITGIRILSLRNNAVIPASKGGKHKTVSQVVSIFIIIVFLLIKEAGENVYSFWNASWDLWSGIIIFIFMAVTVIFTITSGISYIVKNRNNFLKCPD
ncbi:CDP-diacylglycerol--glycerol-3-phosphate 3-phosphatidyltransferase [Candidatus Omnitrophus magneticus]|uniref:CDP-diacylglycerol--glycerol-3-phosphate 3-phosphatidyltransferase n=1 Tax=Candidatus Omnitrophus magneticus TaxID=1609969 RepID=A0A0F0CV39_9BACT|nr:CDP-diacylglycerol--glycerol-3-phosphate 3-phosphatidyltransferase [Candidatus Omnitrophus magneticus]